MYLARFELHPSYISYIVGLGNGTAACSPGLGREKWAKRIATKQRESRRSSNVIRLGTKFATIMIVTVELILRVFGPGLDG